MPTPQLAKTHPGILATDDSYTIEQKVLGQLSRIRAGLDDHIAQEKESGGADSPNFCPNGLINIPCCYVDDATARYIHDSAVYGLNVAINNLEEHGLFLIDVYEWQSTDFTDEDDAAPFPHHEIGLTFRLRVGAAEYHGKYRDQGAQKFIEAKQKFDAGTLHDRPDGENGSLAELLRQLGQ